MDKKKVKELTLDTLTRIKEAMSSTDDAILSLTLANIASKIALIGVEVNKSDWVSVEDGLPPYGEEVFVTSKMAPDNIFKDRRVECNTKPKDSNDFIILWNGRMARITHWKPIEKLED
jgi:hypothetical protein